LPPEHRIRINQLLDEQQSYQTICEEMAGHGISLNTDNLSKWYSQQYQDYLDAMERNEQMHSLRDQVFAFGQQTAYAKFQEGLVQIGLTKIFRAINDDTLGDDPLNSIRLFNAMARLSREALVLRKYSDQSAKAQIAELKRRDPTRAFNENEKNATQDRADDFFGWKSAARLKGKDEFHLVPNISLPNEASHEQSRNGPATTASSLHQPVPADPGNASVPAGLESTTKSGSDEFHLVPNISLPNQAFHEQSRSGPAATASSLDQPVPADPGNASVPAGLESTTKSGKDEFHLVPNISLPNQAFHKQSRSGPAATASSLNQLAPVPAASPSEHCLECQVRLPALLPGGGRPSYFCSECHAPLPPPGDCQQPGIEKCPDCHANLPRLRPDGERPTQRCHNCGNTLPPPAPMLPPENQSHAA
jgi:hypothetical protein